MGLGCTAPGVIELDTSGGDRLFELFPTVISIKISVVGKFDIHFFRKKYRTFTR